jgi:hypothetical protein
MIDLTGPDTQILFAYSERNKPEEEKFFEEVSQTYLIQHVSCLNAYM